jgi:hypothetical protein
MDRCPSYELTGAGAIPGVGAIDAIEKRREDCGPQSLLSISMIPPDDEVITSGKNYICLAGSLPMIYI